MRRKSKTCKGKNGPLTEYDSAEDARCAAWFMDDMIPYLHECGKWHLKPLDRYTPCVMCYDCPTAKMAYETKEYAEKRAAITYKEKGIRLRVYQCPFGNGWHTTKKHATNCIA